LDFKYCSYYFFIFGIFTSDIQKALSILILICFLTKINISNQRILNIHEKINDKFFLFINWIFKNPWKVGMIIFLLLIFSYGLKGFYLTESGYDVGFFLQALSNPYYNGIFQFKTISGINSFFLNHFEPFLFLLYPIKFLPYPSFFLYCLIFFFIALTFIFGIKFIDKETNFPIEIKFSLLLTCATSPFWIGVISYEFHEFSFIPFLYLMLFIFWYKKSYCKFLFFALLSLCFKETISITFIWSGLLLILFSIKKDKKFGFTLFILGVIFYYIYFKIILVNLKESSDTNFIGYYAKLGNSMFEVALSPILKPQVFIQSVMQLKNLSYLFLLFLPILLYIKKGWKLLLFAVPTIFIVILAEYKALADYRNQYGAEVLIPLCLCAFYSLKNSFNNNQLNNLKSFYNRLIIGSSICLFIYFININPIREIKHFLREPQNIIFTYKLQSIPLNEKVITNTDNTYPFIANRPDLILVENFSKYSDEEIKKIKYFVYKIEENQTQKPFLPDNAKLISQFKNFYLYKIESN